MPPSDVVVRPVPQRTDNYAYLVAAPGADAVVVVDASEPEPIEAALEGRRLAAVLSTHHHADHTAANEALRARHGAEVVGFAPDAARIPALTRGVDDGERFMIAGLAIAVRHVPCHTRGHVVYVVDGAPDAHAFVGDTLFSAGAGRLFEGTAADLHHALHDVIGALPDATWLYPGHEYTLANLRFAALLEPELPARREREREAEALRADGRPTVPVRLGAERTYNPFLRTGGAHRSEAIAAAVRAARPDVDVDDPIALLGAVRAWKDEHR